MDTRVVVKQHQKRKHLLSQAKHGRQPAPIHIMPSKMDMDIEAKATEPQPYIQQPAIPQADQPVRRSQRIWRAPERLIETV